MLNLEKKVFSDFNLLKEDFAKANPFPHVVIDNFLDLELARALDQEFPSLDSDLWYKYKNAIEYKKTYNHWEAFPSKTYQFFAYLNSKRFIDKLNQMMPEVELWPDMGLNGGGWHAHGAGGKLNTHLDYSIHPKLGMERRLNIIIYINEKYKSEWGGALGLWSHDDAENQPKDLIKSVEPVFNRAVIFDTTCNSWHGLPKVITCPENEARRSLAIYYLSEARETSSRRGKALFAPSDSQKGDKEILELIKKRAEVKSADNVYRK
ncbi:2OG-Fe(II) oxygenase [Cysteiniphilum halobium]|uniref:2OG-Fe(II) oxygenase n=1 Tax=Cysteiniphilum halobium TaxID=2219059 RepID=UPI000E659A17|nr:2OG-Fe(II) oxygenase [Cysteiniphilum halobium]